MRGAPVALAALLAGGLCAGCATGGGAPDPAFSYLLAAPIPRERVLERVSISPGVEVRVMTHVLFWIPTRSSAATLEEAVDEALRRGHGNVLVNASAERVAWYVPPFYGREGWVVRGDVVRLRERTPPPDEPAAPSSPDPWSRSGEDRPAAEPEP